MVHKKLKIDKFLLFLILLLMAISITTIYSSRTILTDEYQNLYLKQIVWYIIGFILILFVILLKKDFFLKYIWIAYIIGNILLIALLIFGKPVHNAKCWFTIPIFGNFQPSEFMKIILILILSKVIQDFNKNFNNASLKEEFYFLLKIGLIVGIPSILTFLEPDTGVVLIYLLITFIMLFISGIRFRWFFFLFFSMAIFITFLLLIYLKNQELFIKIFGTSFFLRVDRLLDWSNKSGYQLTNGMTAIGSAGITGHGFLKTPIYFPEAQTDFIFAVYASNFGLIGTFLLLIIFSVLDIKIISIALKSKKNINKYIIAGIIGMLLYQQFQNIGMTIGIMPITGITLPFISYGGSSLISYMFIMAIVFSIANDY